MELDDKKDCKGYLELKNSLRAAINGGGRTMDDPLSKILEGESREDAIFLAKKNLVEVEGKGVFFMHHIIWICEHPNSSLCSILIHPIFALHVFSPNKEWSHHGHGCMLCV